jgi:hypothetical protein
MAFKHYINAEDIDWLVGHTKRLFSSDTKPNLIGIFLVKSVKVITHTSCRNELLSKIENDLKTTISCSLYDRITDTSTNTPVDLLHFALEQIWIPFYRIVLKEQIPRYSSTMDMYQNLKVQRQIGIAISQQDTIMPKMKTNEEPHSGRYVLENITRTRRHTIPKDAEMFIPPTKSITQESEEIIGYRPQETPKRMRSDEARSEDRPAKKRTMFGLLPSGPTQEVPSGAVRTTRPRQTTVRRRPPRRSRETRFGAPPLTFPVESPVQSSSIQQARTQFGRVPLGFPVASPLGPPAEALPAEALPAEAPPVATPLGPPAEVFPVATPPSVSQSQSRTTSEETQSGRESHARQADVDLLSSSLGAIGFDQ